jgi:hypothetical protein
MGPVGALNPIEIDLMQEPPQLIGCEHGNFHAEFARPTECRAQDALSGGMPKAIGSYGQVPTIWYKEQWGSEEPFVFDPKARC